MEPNLRTYIIHSNLRISLSYIFKYVARKDINKLTVHTLLSVGTLALRHAIKSY